MFDIKKLTLSPEEAQDIKGAIFELAFQTDKYNKLHELHTGLQWDTQIPMIGNYGLTGRLVTGCSAPTDAAKIPISDKKWSLKTIGGKMEYCATDGDFQLKLFGKVKSTNELYNKIDSPYIGTALKLYTDAVTESITRLAWFGDTAAKNVSANGTITNGQDVAYFTPIDGIWKQIFAEVPTTSKYYVPITQNTSASKTAQNTLTSDFAYTLFESMLSKLDSRVLLNGKDGLTFHVSGAIAANWQAYKRSKSLGFTLNTVENGGVVDYFDGIQIVARYDWDKTILTAQDNGTKLNLPHRALLTTSGNIPLGTLNEDDFIDIQSYFSEDTDKTVLKYKYSIDAKFLQPEMSVVAY